MDEIKVKTKSLEKLVLGLDDTVNALKTIVKEAFETQEEEKTDGFGKHDKIGDLGV